MIYRSSYFKKEARQAYLDSRISLRRRMSLALFTGLAAFGVFFVLQTLKESVLSDAVPEIMQPSFYSTLYIYIHAAVLAAMVYFIVYYDFLFFSEIRRNAWYMLIQLRYRPAVMIFGKLSALLWSALIIYTAGFAFTALLTVFLKYTFVYAYMPALYVAGLIDILLLTALCAAVSLLVKKREDAQLLVVASVVLVFVLKAAADFYGILRNRVAMQEFGVLFDMGQSWYVPAATVLFIICIAAASLRASHLARLYSVSARAEDALPAGVEIVRVDPDTGKRQETRKAAPSGHRAWLSAAVTALLIVFILAALAFNVLIILISTATPGNEITIRGTIPYIFQSDTMQPSIEINDLAFFRKIDVQYPLSEDQIVLFKDNNIVYVERITQITDDTVKVDIDHYPPAAEAGAMVKDIPRSAVYGIYSGRSRWLGALILFANTIIGRIVFLLVPAVLLFYQKRIAALYRKRRET